MGNWVKLGTQEHNDVINIYEGMSDNFTYRQYRYDRNRTQGERISFEYEPDVFEINNEENEYMLDALNELGIDIEEISFEQYNDEEEYNNC